MASALYFGFLLILAYFFANVEVQIEGTAGWAQNLPTWRIEKHWLLDIFFGGRPMTGYHAWVLSFVILFFHIPFFFFHHWSPWLEARVIGGFIIFWIAEDFLWFVINPGYGIKKFKKKYIPWHPKWFLIAPIEYWIFLPIGCALILCSNIHVLFSVVHAA